ncbi:MAG: cytochrome c [Phycisphaerales bacterium]
MKSGIGVWALVGIAGLSVTIASCTHSQKDSGTTQAAKVTKHVPVTIPIPSAAETKPLDFPGIHNAVTYHDGFVSGSAPEGEAGFDTLAGMGFKTIISVDGAMPEVDKAAARGIRYIHLPIGYNGFDEKRKMQLVRATRDAMKDGPVYIHCHHGKHRSAGAAAAIATSLGWETAEEGVARMKVSGTAPNYRGLYSCAANSTVVSMDLIDDVPADFPEVWKPSDFVGAMVEIDEVLENLKTIEKAAWKVPANHPDLVPAAEAGRMADLYRLMETGEYAANKPAEFQTLLRQAQQAAQGLEDAIVAGDSAVIGAKFKVVTESCKGCHSKFRD